MDYSGFKDFPFPQNLSSEDEELKKYFLSLSDGEQLKLLNGSGSYDAFHERAAHYRDIMRLMNAP